jgi:hypothetical protein
MREEITSSSSFPRRGAPRRGVRPRPGRALVLAGLAGLGSLAAGCGDGPICASDIAVFITAPDQGSMFWDGDDGLPGVQSDVVVRTNLHQSELVELRVIDQFGLVEMYSTRVDAEGAARFPTLTLPEGPLTLEATGITEQCGSGQDVIEIDVFGNTGCEIEVREQPVPNEYYAPLLVLGAFNDSNLAFEGFQANVDVWTQPGAEVELTVIELDTGLQTPVGPRLADGVGLADYGVTVPEGAQALEARCISPDGSSETVSTRLSLWVDTVPPTCRLVSPEPGVALSPTLDDDGDPSNGTQIELIGEVVDDDQNGATPLLPLFIVNEVIFQGSEVGADGTSKVTVELDDAGSYVLGVQTADRAGNLCFDVWPFDYTLLTGLEMQAISRHSALLSWVSPDLSGLGTPPIAYTVRIAEEPIDEFNFDEVGQVVEGAPEPGLPGAAESMLIDALTPGRTYYAAVMGESDFGRKFIGAAGPAALAFDVTGVIGPVAPSDGDNGLGYQVAAGDFNADSFSDLAMSAPFKSVNGQAGAGAVYVYFGGPDGMGATPDMTIEGSAAGEQLGSGLTTIDWNNDDADDLAVGVPFAAGGNGQVQVFLAASDFASSGPPDVTIDASSAAGNWFAFSGLGFALTRARFDGDSRDDLVISAPGGGDGNGGVVVLYGGATLSNIVLSSQTAAGSGDAVAVVLQDPDPGSIFDSPPAAFFGHYVFPLGRTEGASDADDDVGVAYTEKNTVVVFRGRARPPGAGVTLGSFGPRDLQIQRTSSTDTSARFGTAMGSIADLNGDGAREIVVGMWRDLANIGRIEIYDGDRVGVQNASTMRLRSITPAADLCGTGGCGLGSAIVNNAAGLIKPDVNGDGLEDLIVVGGMGAGRVKMLVWFGGSIPTTPDISSDSAQYVIEAPSFEAAAIGDSDATPITALWGGDVNGDGLEDICWADWSSSDGDGSFVVLYDDGQ